MIQSLQKQITIRLITALVTMALLVSAGIYLLHERTLEHTRQNRIRVLTAYHKHWMAAYEERTAQTAFAIRTSIEFSGVLDLPSGARERFQAYFLSLSSSGMQFTHAIVVDQTGRTVVQAGPKDELPAIGAFPARSADWHFEADRGTLYRVTKQNLRLGKRGAGALFLFQPLGNSMLVEGAHPESVVYLLWDGKVIASSRGQEGGENFVRRSGEVHSGLNYEAVVTIPWIGRGTAAEKAPVLNAWIRVPDNLPFLEVTGITLVALAAMISLLYWLLGAWLGRILQRVEVLRNRARLFTQERSPPALSEVLPGGGPGGLDEVAELDAEFSIMIEAVLVRERDLCASEEQYRTIFDAASDGIIIADPRTQRFISMNLSMMRMLGIEWDDVAGLSVADIHPADALSRVAGIFEQIVKGEIDHFDNIPLLHKDGRVVITEGSASWLQMKGDRYLAGFFRDVTERKRAAEELEQSYAEVERFRLMVEYSQQAIGTANLDASITYGNSALLGLLGIASLEEFRKYTFKDFYADDDLDYLTETILPAVQSQGSWTGEVPLRALSGRSIPTIHNLYLIRDGQGNPVAFSNIITDISEWKRAEEELWSAKQFSDSLIRTANVLVVVLNSRREVLQLNKTGEEITGYRQEEILGRSWFDVLAPRDRFPEVWEDFLRLTKMKEFASTFSNPIVTKSGAERIISWQNSTLATNNGIVTVSFGIDITERKHAEERHRNILKTAIDGYWLTDAKGRLLEVNDAYCRMSGYSRDELLTMAIPDLEAGENPEETREHIEKIMSQGSDRFVSQHRRKNGTLMDMEISVQYSKEQGGMFIAFLQDVTERKRAEDAIRVSLREKETLLKEVHHRVKNNLQIISSVLYFQAQKIVEPASLAVFEEARNRLRSMVLVHEKLYRSRDLAHVDIRDYLQSLVDELRISHAEKSRGLQVHVKVPELYLPIETALPAGMIINELVTNIFKYAFPSGSGGDAWIRIDRQGGTVRIEVGDNGAGIPVGVSADQPATFGLQLVGNLAKQLNGSVAIERGQGTRVVVSFPISSSMGGSA
ncbi:MAG: PAS domain S-box protein [Nitrospirota bacterium]|nr:PAS domain S-box protein [Nitrospirota bacterium]